MSCDNTLSIFFRGLDHATYRVTYSTFTGVIVGLCFGTFKGLPLGSTTISMASSFALASTACFIPERIFYLSSFGVKPKGSEEEERKRLYMSHCVGGAVGGSVSGGLFRGKPLAGMFLLTPAMIGIAYGELRLQEYKKMRLEELKRS